MLQHLLELSSLDVLIAFVDICIVSYVVYRFILIIRGTRAVPLINGIIILLFGSYLSYRLGLVTVNWLLQKIILMLAVAVPIVFQPELRRALEQLGRGRFFTRSVSSLGEQDIRRLVMEVVRAASILARDKVGGIIVLERETGLEDYVETGVRVDALVSAELLANIFVPNTPLHDGAVIIRGNRMVAAACFLPLTEAPNITPGMGGRHRAALGISEHSDALAVVVSEETGAISLASAGKLIRNLEEATLEEMLTSLCAPKPAPSLLQQIFTRGSGDRE